MIVRGRRKSRAQLSRDARYLWQHAEELSSERAVLDKKSLCSLRENHLAEEVDGTISSTFSSTRSRCLHAGRRCHSIRTSALRIVRAGSSRSRMSRFSLGSLVIGKKETEVPAVWDKI